MATPTYPLIFAKSLSCLKPHGKPFPVPWWAPSDDCVVHEVELGVIMNGLGSHQVENWHDRIAAYVLLTDLNSVRPSEPKLPSSWPRSRTTSCLFPTSSR